MTDTAKGEFKKAMHVGRLTADKVQLGTAGGYGWRPYPLTMTGGTFPTTMVENSARYKIVDTTLYVKFDLSFTSNTGGASTSVYTFNLPNGCTAISPTGSSGLNNACGQFQLSSTSSGNVYLGVAQVSGSSFTILLNTTAATAIPWGNSSPTDTRWTISGGFSGGGLFIVELAASSPILGEAPVQLSNGTGSVLSTVYAGSNSGSLITGQFQ